ncbi:MAG: arsenate reductase, partial [Bacteriovoracaceae bacterium]|nr:arsenate reductase [Bacteriovoracaceae bacterium]
MKVYGIKNCDTVKKALKFLNENELEYEFVDFKKVTPTKADILRWKEAFGDLPVNKRGTTFRK